MGDEYAELVYEVGSEGLIVPEVGQAMSEDGPFCRYPVVPPIRLEEGSYRLRVPLDWPDGTPITLEVDGDRLIPKLGPPHSASN